MSTSRLILRCLLVVILLVVCFFGYKKYQQSSPDYYWTMAENSRKLGDRNAARETYKKLLESQPDRFEAHERLASIYLEEAKENGHPDTMETNPFALRELEHMARLKPEDIELQKRFLTACLAIPYIDSAAVAASHVVEAEPNNPDALFAIAWNELLKKRYAVAEKKLAALEKLSPNPRPFQTMFLRVSYYADTEKESRLQDILEQATTSAVKLPDEEILKQTHFERSSMIQMMVASVQRAKDNATASDRAKRIIEICERLILNEKKVEDKTKNETETGNGSLFSGGGGDKPAKKLRSPDQLAIAGVGYYANLISQALIALNQNFPLDPKDITDKANRDLLSERANAIRLNAIAIEDATPLVYHQAAMVAYNAGKLDDSIKILEKGIEAGKALPDRMQDFVLELYLLAGRELVMARRFDKLEPYVDRLFKEKRDVYQGWGFLLRGAAHTFKGSHELAKEDFEQAKAKLGSTVLVHMALANSYMNLKDWKNALVHLEQLRNVNRNSAEDNSWARLQQATDDQIVWGEYQAYLELGKHDEALKRMAALANHPDFGSKSYAKMAMYFIQKKMLQEAMQVLQEGRQKYPADETVTQLYANLMNSLGKTEEATAAIERLATAAPDSLKAQLHLVRWRIEQKKLKEAIDLCEALQQSKHRDAPEILAMKAQAQLQGDMSQEALKTAEELDRVPGGNSVANLVRLAVSLQQKDLTAAADQLSQLDQNLPDNPTLKVMDGFVDAKLGKFEEAIDKLAKVLDRTNLREQAGQSLLSAALMLSAKKGPAVAEAKIAYHMDKLPPNKHLILARSELCFRMGKFDVGMSYLRELEKLMPNDPIPFTLQAGAFWKRRRADLALPKLDAALKINPKHVDSLSLKAEILFAEKSFKDAGKTATLALKEKPGLTPMEILQLQSLIGLEKKAEAIVMAKAILEKQPKNEVRRILASIYADMGKMDEAMTLYKEAREKSPSSPNKEFDLANRANFDVFADEIALLCKNKRQSDAEKIARSVVGPKPSAMHSLSLAQAFFLAQHYTEAKTWAMGALAGLPDNQKPAAYLMIGRIAMKSGKESNNQQELKEAYENFAHVVKANPRHYEAASSMAYLLAKHFNEPKKAVQIAETLKGDVTLDQLPAEFVEIMAVAYSEAGQADSAEELLWKARDLNPEDPTLNFRLGMVLMKNKKNGSARDVLGKVIEMPNLTADRKEEARLALAKLSEEVSPKQ